MTPRWFRRWVLRRELRNLADWRRICRRESARAEADYRTGRYPDAGRALAEWAMTLDAIDRDIDAALDQLGLLY